MRGLKDSRWATASRPSSTNNSTRSSSVPPPQIYSKGPSEASTAFSKSPATKEIHNAAAPPPLTDRPAYRPLPSLATRQPAQELARYSKIVRRLTWKLPYLADGYHAATSQSAGPERRAEAEFMFKLDFYEYYMLLERALVHLLGVYDIHIPSRGDMGSKHCGASKAPTTTHRYHANVLAALDQENNPFHHILGQGEVRRLLGRAKDLRNRWKHAEEDEQSPASTQATGLRASRHATGSSRRRFGAQELSTYDVENMLLHIFIAFDSAFKIADEYVTSLAIAAVSTLGREPTVDTAMVMDWRVEDEKEEHWDFMVDAMDWEAV